MIFDEALINSSRDLLEDGQLIVIECLVKKDDGGTRIITKNITNLASTIFDKDRGQINLPEGLKIVWDKDYINLEKN